MSNIGPFDKWTIFNPPVLICSLDCFINFTCYHTFYLSLFAMSVTLETPTTTFWNVYFRRTCLKAF